MFYYLNAKLLFIFEYIKQGRLQPPFFITHHDSSLYNK